MSRCASGRLARIRSPVPARATAFLPTGGGARAPVWTGPDGGPDRFGARNRHRSAEKRPLAPADCGPSALHRSVVADRNPPAQTDAFRRPQAWAPARAATPSVIINLSQYHDHVWSPKVQTGVVTVGPDGAATPSGPTFRCPRTQPS